MQLCIEYSRITNQTLHSFSPTVQQFECKWQLPIAHSTFKQYSECPPAACSKTYQSLVRNDMIALISIKFSGI